MLRVAVCDDEAVEAERIEGFVRAYDDCDISVYTNSKKLAQDVEDGGAFDLYLLDVAMPGLDGIELARFIRMFDKTAVIMFLTSHDERSLDAYRVHASQYLVKPVCFDALRNELDAALASVNARNAKTFLLKMKDGTEAIPFHRIVYCELNDRVLHCMTADGEKLKSTTLRVPFDEAVAPLISDTRFIRPHMSFVVNLDFVRRIHKNMLIMRVDGNIPVARRLVGDIREKYLKHFFRGERE